MMSIRRQCWYGKLHFCCARTLAAPADLFPLQIQGDALFQEVYRIALGTCDQTSKLEQLNTLFQGRKIPSYVLQYLQRLNIHIACPGSQVVDTPSPLIQALQEADIQFLTSGCAQLEEYARLFGGLTYEGTSALGHVIRIFAISNGADEALVSSVLQSSWFRSLAELEADIKSDGFLPIVSAVQFGLRDVVAKLCQIRDVTDDQGYSGTQLWSIRQAAEIRLSASPKDAVSQLLSSKISTQCDYFPESVFVWLWEHKQNCERCPNIMETIHKAFDNSLSTTESALHCTSPKHVLGCLGFPVDPSWHKLDRYQCTPAHYQIDAGNASGLDALLAADDQIFSSENRPSYSLQHAVAREQFVFKFVPQNAMCCRLDVPGFADAFTFSKDGNQFCFTENDFKPSGELLRRFGSSCSISGSCRPFSDSLANDRLLGVDQELLKTVGNQIKYSQMLKRSKCQHALARWWHWPIMVQISQAQVRLESSFFKSSLHGTQCELQFDKLVYTATLGVQLALSEFQLVADNVYNQDQCSLTEKENNISHDSAFDELVNRSQKTFNLIIDSLQDLRNDGQRQARLLQLLYGPADVLLHVYAIYDICPDSAQAKYVSFCFKVCGGRAKIQELLALACAHHSVNFLALCFQRGFMKLNVPPLSETIFLKYGYEDVEDLSYVWKDMSLLAQYPVSLCGVTPLMLYLIGKHQTGAFSRCINQKSIRFVEKSLVNQYSGFVDEQGNPALAYALLMDDLDLIQDLEHEGEIVNCFGNTPYETRALNIEQDFLLEEQHIDGEVVIYCLNKLKDSNKLNSLRSLLAEEQRTGCSAGRPANEQ